MTLHEWRARIDQYLAQRLQLMPPGELREAIGYAFASGGKRVRPAIVLMVADVLGAPSPLAAASAVECFHIASLIADDLPCMDDADARRERPSLHKVFGQATALLVTYALIAEGYAALDGRPEVVAVAARNTGVHGLTGGQCDDLRSKLLNEQQLERLIWKKTGALFDMAFVFGWLYGRGDLNQLDQISRLAAHYALAFQIADDLADQEEDKLNRGSINYALAFGTARAQERLEFELDQYVEGLRQTGLECEGLVTLIEPLRPLITV
jgi:geranylgeranyl diphosphate synthase, type II